MFLKNNITIIFSLSIEGGGLGLFVFESKWAILTRQHSKICHDTLGKPIFHRCVTSTVNKHADAHTSSPQALVISILSRVKIVAHVS